MTQPLLYMIAGPNGAGKTTSAMELLPDFLSVYEFVNADDIARGLNPLNPEGQDVIAGRLMLERMDKLTASRKSFAFETTGASHVFAAKMKAARAAGYRLVLLYLWLPNAEMAKQRVRHRVAQGGHNIPDADVDRRYGRGLHNLIHLYLPLVDEAHLFDARQPTVSERDLITRKIGDEFDIIQPALWEKIERVKDARTK